MEKIANFLMALFIIITPSLILYPTNKITTIKQCHIIKEYNENYYSITRKQFDDFKEVPITIASLEIDEDYIIEKEKLDNIKTIIANAKSKVKTAAMIDSPLYMPIKSFRVTSHYNNERLHPIDGIIKEHDGLDIAGEYPGAWVEVYSVGFGEVIHIKEAKWQPYNIWDKAGEYTGIGQAVYVYHKDIDKIIMYGHLYSIDVKIGDALSPYSKIGIMGNTGTSSGPHLHLSIYDYFNWDEMKGEGSQDPIPFIYCPGFSFEEEAFNNECFDLRN